MTLQLMVVLLGIKYEIKLSLDLFTDILCRFVIYPCSSPLKIGTFGMGRSISIGCGDWFSEEGAFGWPRAVFPIFLASP